jgi:hypothetical protein
MLRIGLAASKIAQGNLWFYHLSVVVITCLFALCTFFVCGFILGVTIFVLSLVALHVLHLGDGQIWLGVLRICLYLLGILVGIAALIAIMKNIKFRA